MEKYKKSFNMSWSRGHSSLIENLFNKPIVDLYLNCVDQEEVQATITMEFGEGNLNTGPISIKIGFTPI
tara:strand:+ start:53 stop:259 length:207 start_codon:yes stop_codon:yes gene_type:complete